MEQAPLLETLTRRLAECPPDFLAEAASTARPQGVHAAVVVSDLLRDMGGAALDSAQAADFAPAGDAPGRRRLRVILVACWVLHHPWFRSRRCFAGPAHEFLRNGLGSLAQLVKAEDFITVPERREEMARLILRALELRPPGETAAQAEDRLSGLDTVETARVVEESRKQQERARAVLDAMKKKAALEAAPKATRE